MFRGPNWPIFGTKQLYFYPCTLAIAWVFRWEVSSPPPPPHPSSHPPTSHLQLLDADNINVSLLGTEKAMGGAWVLC